MAVDPLQRLCLRLAEDDEVVVGSRADKTQQRGAPDPALEARYEFLFNLAADEPGRFLTRYGSTLTQPELQVFSVIDDYEVSFLVRKYKDRLTNQHSLVKNRRYMAMQRLLAEGTYFSLEEMQRRCPWLYDAMVGQYVTDEHLQARIDAHNRGTWAEQLLSQVEHSQTNLRLEAEVYMSGGGTGDDEASRPEDADGDPGAIGPIDFEARETRRLAMPTEERERLEGEFRSLMEQRFLAGEDEEFFNYREIDTDETLDDLKTRERDEEEAWFDAD
ncbi:uncharacterized protein MONBRDRAFT_31188 [Monosiga brevicollis MX1]|uniref:CCD97-like C-terminal domain-containing protein n=1 Tax=Monosiga brevicollis TaxID=81824 RepID=A9US89_MONBE|nr:uncharacterized protein MONBRDRAFT_31188 [Monosiga brevicollis MX1]EDQ92059.1 predicted protein [Monosiga brevicollis MX1]|eukprot:XP_001743345.1 hypothetical protein [Monosiga brevicollis MX1]